MALQKFCRSRSTAWIGNRCLCRRPMYGSPGHWRAVRQRPKMPLQNGQKNWFLSIALPRRSTARCERLAAWPLESDKKSECRWARCLQSLGTRRAFGRNLNRIFNLYGRWVNRQVSTFIRSHSSGISFGSRWGQACRRPDCRLYLISPERIEHPAISRARLRAALDGRRCRGLPAAVEGRGRLSHRARRRTLRPVCQQRGVPSS